MSAPRITCALAAAAALSGVAHAAPSTCIRVESDLDRLACYDREAGRTPTVASRPGPWNVRIETSKLTDTSNVYLSVASDEMIECRWRESRPITLLIRCMENTTSVYIATGCHMTSSRYNNYGHVTYRLDDDKSAVIPMEESTNHHSLGLWSGGRAIPFIKKLFGKSRMIVRMVPYGENPFTATFQIAGLDKAIEPLRKSCHW